MCHFFNQQYFIFFWSLLSCEEEMKRIKLCPSSSPIHGNYSSSPQLPVGIIANRRPSGPFEIRVPWMMGNQPLINHHNFRQPIVIGNIPRGGSSVLWCCLPPPRQLRGLKFHWHNTIASLNRFKMYFLYLFSSQKTSLSVWKKAGN